MTNDPRQLRWPQWLPWVIAAGALLALYRLGEKILVDIGHVLGPVLVPLFLALAFAYLLEPIVEWLHDKFKFGREAAILTAIVVGGLILGMSILFIIPPLVAQLIESAQRLPPAILSAVQQLEPYLQRLRDSYPTAYEEAKRRLLALIQGVGPPSAGRVFGITGNILDLILIPVFTFYVLRDLDLFRHGIERLIPSRYQPRMSRLFDHAGRVVSNFVRGQLTVAVILSVLYTVGFWMARVPHAASLGILAGFGYLIPYIGMLLAVLLTILLVLLTHPAWSSVIGVVIVYLIVHGLESFIITPRILGDRLKLHPMLVIIGVIIGGKLFGILGVVLALPVMALLKVLLEALMEPYFASEYYKTNVQVSATNSQASIPRPPSSDRETE
jgi:predicted PurR-regulated permease PerM